MKEIDLSEIRFRAVQPPDMALLEKWYSMTDQLGYATGFKSLTEVKEKILTYPMMSMMIVLGHDQAAGFVCCELRSLDGGDVAWIHIIIIDPAFQNRGIGTWVVRKLLKSFASRGTSAVMASVSRHNTRGLRFWESLGFMPSTAMEKTLSNSGTSDVAIMKKNLTGNQA